MDVKFETLVSVWDNQIPKLLIDFVNTAVFTRSENELRTAIAYLSESTDFDKFFAYGYGSHHFWLNQRLPSDTSKCMENRLLIVEF
ncbi:MULTISPECIES: hypothetical protein [Bacteroides]|uniref:hypothetical protein n=1 Tax=Bacteroides TaxID=816 RepID=UPI0026596DF5|nr:MULTISPECIES: hypothetical protein [Bacteroides]